MTTAIKTESSQKTVKNNDLLSVKTAETKESNLIKTKHNTVTKQGFIRKGNKILFAKGNQLAKGRRKQKPFSLREDLIKSLKQIKRTDKKLYKEIIMSYWKDPKMRQFLLEIVDGKARQSMAFSGSLQNPVRVIEVKEMAKKDEV